VQMAAKDEAIRWALHFCLFSEGVHDCSTWFHGHTFKYGFVIANEGSLCVKRAAEARCAAQMAVEDEAIR
jgi:hypothetical protein